MSVLVNHVRRSFYMDSVALMRLSQSVSALPGIERAALMIGTGTNKSLMREAGLLNADGEKAGANDLIMAIIAANDAGEAEQALKEAQALLDRPADTGQSSGTWDPKTIETAVQQLAGANLALISVPGEFAASEARRAMRHGLHVMMFSDNVSVSDEVSLKNEARERGQLMMGPDCGTAIIGGTPLAFANVVPRGSIGIVAASGTGLQEVSTLLARNGHGISHAIGVGGRDLKDEVGGMMTLMAIDALDGDAATETTVLISKPPSPAVAARIAERVAASAKPFVICFLGTQKMDLPKNARLALDLRSAAEAAMGKPIAAADSGPPAQAASRIGGGRRLVQGLFCGGTLCAEAQLIFQRAGLDVASNVPVPGAKSVGDIGKPNRAHHVLLDLGADEYTVGRPHPMIDPSTRDAMIKAALADPETAVVLADLVIGYGAHPDPAAELVASLGSMGRGALMVASICGTEQDPQVYSRQAQTLADAGVIVAASNAHAAEFALAAVKALR